MNCPDCGEPMRFVEKSTVTGQDIREFYCERCKKDQVMDNGIALWQAMSDAREAAEPKRARSREIWRFFSRVWRS